MHLGILLRYGEALFSIGCVCKFVCDFFNLFVCYHILHENDIAVVVIQFSAYSYRLEDHAKFHTPVRGPKTHRSPQ